MAKAFKTAATVVLALGVLALGHRVDRSLRMADSFQRGGDFATVYTASRVFLAGGNPYDQPQVDAAWARYGNGVGDATPNTVRTPSVYPPGTLLLVAPVTAAGDWERARQLWVILTALATIATVAVLPGLAGRRWTDPWGLALVAAALAQEVFRTGPLLGQPAVITTALIVLAARTAGAGRDGWAGVALAVAMSLKPQMAGGFVAYYLLRRRWRLAAIAMAVPLVLNLMATAWLWGHGVHWYHALLDNLSAASAPGAVNDAAPTGRQRFELVNVQLILFAFVSQPWLVRAATAALAVAGGAAFAWAVVRHASARDPIANPDVARDGLPARGLAELGFVAAFGLLPVYHRWYDGGPLVLALAWAAAAGAAGPPVVAGRGRGGAGDRPVHGQHRPAVLPQPRRPAAGPGAVRPAARPAHAAADPARAVVDPAAGERPAPPAAVASEGATPGGRHVTGGSGRRSARRSRPTRPVGPPRRRSPGPGTPRRTARSRCTPAGPRTTARPQRTRPRSPSGECSPSGTPSRKRCP